MTHLKESKDRMTLRDRLEEQYDALEARIVKGKPSKRTLSEYNTIVWMTKQVTHG